MDNVYVEYVYVEYVYADYECVDYEDDDDVAVHNIHPIQYLNHLRLHQR